MSELLNNPINNVGAGYYQGFQGGMYPGGNAKRPAAYDALCVAAGNRVIPRDTTGASAPATGSIVMVGIGMSNAQTEFGNPGFTDVHNGFPGKNNKLATWCNGAAGGADSTVWGNLPGDAVWQNMLSSQPFTGGKTFNQVQVVLMEMALKLPQPYGAFPAHAQAHKYWLGKVFANLLTNFPFVQQAIISSMTHAYISPGDTGYATSEQPEPWAYEGSFGVKWFIEDMINGKVPNWGGTNQPVCLWGEPYVWRSSLQYPATSGIYTGRNDGGTWTSSDVNNTDFVHPTTSGAYKVATDLVNFLATDPATKGWYL